MRRFILAALLAAMAVPQVAHAADVPGYGSLHSFAAFRHGQNIGRHTISFQRNGSEVTVSTSVDFAVKVLGLTAYRYTNRTREVWNGDTFMALSAQTDDNGKKFRVDIKRDLSGLRVERFAQSEVVRASTADEGFPHHATIRETVPGQVLPTTYWNFRQLRQGVLLDTQYGTEAHVHAVTIGRETIKTATGTLQATHYRYSGDIAMDQWFDSRDRWVKATFVAYDGSTIEYILQE